LKAGHSIPQHTKPVPTFISCHNEPLQQIIPHGDKPHHVLYQRIPHVGGQEARDGNDDILYNGNKLDAIIELGVS